jgi:hypothetical protein
MQKGERRIVLEALVMTGLCVTSSWPTPKVDTTTSPSPDREDLCNNNNNNNNAEQGTEVWTLQDMNMSLKNEGPFLDGSLGEARVSLKVISPSTVTHPLTTSLSHHLHPRPRLKEGLSTKGQSLRPLITSVTPSLVHTVLQSYAVFVPQPHNVVTHTTYKLQHPPLPPSHSRIMLKEEEKVNCKESSAIQIPTLSNNNKCKTLQVPHPHPQILLMASPNFINILLLPTAWKNRERV